MGYGRQADWLIDIERAMRLDHARRKMIPTPQIFHRHIEPVSDCDQCVPSSRGVAQRMWGRNRARRWNNKLVTSFYRCVGGEPIRRGQFRWPIVEAARYAIERLAGAHNVKAPAGPLVLGNLLDAL